MRMRVDDGHASVRRPARMSYSSRSGHILVQEHFLEVGDFANLFDDLEPFFIGNRDPGRIISPVFKPFHSVKKNVNSNSEPHVANNAAHGVFRTAFLIAHGTAVPCPGNRFPSFGLQALRVCSAPRGHPPNIRFSLVLVNWEKPVLALPLNAAFLPAHHLLSGNRVFDHLSQHGILHRHPHICIEPSGLRPAIEPRPRIDDSPHRLPIRE